MNLPARSKNIISVSGLIILSLLVSIGTLRAFSRGANDFSVFYQAWSLVLSGHGQDIYRVSPDRFLYAPGFAWLFAPLGFFPRSTALAIWCLAKAGVVGFLVKELSKPWSHRAKLSSIGLSAWGMLLLARPLLIDFEYGQVNLFVLAACVWALLGHFNQKNSTNDAFRWCLLAFAAVAKLFPLPLLLVPWALVRGINPKKIKRERRAVILGCLIALLIPIITQGVGGLPQLFIGWQEALLARGLPLESHNQSFTALLYHYLSGHPTQVLSEGVQPLIFGTDWLSQSQIAFLSISWTFITLGVTLGWILISGLSQPPLVWLSVAIGLLIVPSHLIWKPYFVMSVPLAVFIFHQNIKRGQWSHWLMTLGIFSAINLTGFDFVGHNWAAHFEASSLMLLMHLLMIYLVARTHSTWVDSGKETGFLK